MQYCPHCMKPVTEARCPNCGGDVSWIGQKGIDLPVGTVLNGGNGLRTFQIGAARGKGGFGITYIALETNSGRRMAIKEYFPTRCAFRGGNGVDVQAMTGQEEPFQNGMRSFLEEGKMLLSQDDLSCVVHVIDYFQANGTAYLVMEYLDGVALHAQMTRMGGRIPVGELMPRLSLLMRDIGQLHKRGVIHRDISPDNIMWMPDGGLKLLDFGSARSMESGKSMTVLMKQGFSPIEQYRSKGQGPYTDIYALAATIYYCITGVIPPASMERLAEDTLQSPIALGAALTVQQETALLWALSIQPNGRPQSMEEFSAMLYKEERPPEAVRVEPPRPGYAVPAGPRPQPTPPHQVPPQPVGPGQYSGQPVGQPAGPGQNWTGGGGGNKKLPVIIGAAAAVVVLVVGVFAWLTWGRKDTAEDPPGASSQSVAPAYSMPPVTSMTPASSLPPMSSRAPEPSRAPVSADPTQAPAATVDGFLYDIVDQNHVVITGCVADAKFSYMPDFVDDIPITGIADGAFAGKSIGGSVNLPFYLETIGAYAFRGCTDLSYVYAYSDVVTASNSFSGCDDMWFVAVCEEGMDLSGWNLPTGVSLFYYGMDTGAGALSDISKNGSMLLGETASGNTVLLDVKPGTTAVNGLLDVNWICPWALNNLRYGASVELGPETVYPYETYVGATWTWTVPESSLADMWRLSCETARSINEARPSGATQIRPDIEVVKAARVRAAEFAELRDISNRPGGGNSFTVLEEMEIGFNWSAVVAGARNEYLEAWNRAVEYITEEYAAALTQSDSSQFAGQYYSLIGVAVNKEYDGQYTWSGYLIIP